MAPFMILIVIIVVILVVWWALLRNVKNYKPDFDVHEHEDHAETGHGETAFGHLDSAERTLLAQEAVEEPAAPAAVDTATQEAAAAHIDATPMSMSSAGIYDIPTAVAADTPQVTLGETPEGSLAAGRAGDVTGDVLAGANDDLTILEGVGPKVSEILHQNGIHTFAALAATDVTRLREILEAHSLRFIDPATWPQQARLAAEGRMDELQAYTATLRGGRTVS